jgi:hypothetical protein
MDEHDQPADFNREVEQLSLDDGATPIGVFNNLPWYANRTTTWKTTCRHCKHAVIEYPFQIIPHVLKFLRAIRHRTEPTRLGDLGLVKAEYTSGYRASYWGLAIPMGDGERGPWLISESGVEFIDGRLRIPAVVIQAGRAVRRYEGDAWLPSDVPLTGSGECYSHYRDIKKNAPEQLE